MSHAGMTTVWPPPAAPLKNSHTSQSTQTGLDGPPAWTELHTAPSKYHVPTCTHINTHTHTYREYWSRYRGWECLPLSHIRALLYRCDYITQSHDTPSLHVIQFQEHWAHKPGHVVLCPVCQNNSAVSITVRPRFHSSLARYCGTLECVASPMTTSLHFSERLKAFILEWVKPRPLGGPSMCMILWNLCPLSMTVCHDSLRVTVC